MYWQIQAVDGANIEELDDDSNDGDFSSSRSKSRGGRGGRSKRSLPDDDDDVYSSGKKRSKARRLEAPSPGKVKMMKKLIDIVSKYQDR